MCTVSDEQPVSLTEDGPRLSTARSHVAGEEAPISQRHACSELATSGVVGDVEPPPHRFVNAAASPGLVRLRELVHVALPVRRLEASVAFWEGVLAFPLARRARRDVRARALRVGSHEVQLFESPARGAGAVRVRPGRSYAKGEPTLLLKTTSIGEVLARLRIAGISVERHTLDLEAPRQGLLTQDPDGYWVAFVEDDGAGQGPEPGAFVTGLLGFSTAVTSLRRAFEDFHRVLGLPLLPRAPSGQRPAGVDVGNDARLFFVREPAIAARLSALGGVPTNELHVRVRGRVDEARLRAQLRAAGVRRGGADDRLFTEARAAQLLIAIAPHREAVVAEHQTLRDVAPLASS